MERIRHFILAQDIKYDLMHLAGEPCLLRPILQWLRCHRELSLDEPHPDLYYCACSSPQGSFQEAL